MKITYEIESSMPAEGTDYVTTEGASINTSIISTVQDSMSASPDSINSEDDANSGDDADSGDDTDSGDDAYSADDTDSETSTDHRDYITDVERFEFDVDGTSDQDNTTLFACFWMDTLDDGLLLVSTKTKGELILVPREAQRIRQEKKIRDDARKIVYEERLALINLYRQNRDFMLTQPPPETASMQESLPELPLEIQFRILCYLLEPRVLAIHRASDGLLELVPSLERFPNFSVMSCALRNQSKKTHVAAFGDIFNKTVLFNANTDVVLCHDTTSIKQLASTITSALVQQTDIQYLAVNVFGEREDADAVVVAVQRLGTIQKLILIAPDYTWDPYKRDLYYSMEKIERIRAEALLEWKKRVEYWLDLAWSRAGAIWYVSNL